ncbi:MAG: Panacea domain-containing protein [Limisphaerales bacterium]
MNEFPYNPVRATQAAAWLVSRAGGKMNVIRLSKLLYIADREALRRWGRPIIGGDYASMEHGPVISQVVDCLKTTEERGGPRTTWDKHLRREGNYIHLVEDPGRGQLHAAATKLLDAIFADCRNLTQWEVRDLTHKFPEYENPGTSSKPIDMEDVLRAVDKDESEIESLSADAMHLRQVKRLIGC